MGRCHEFGSQITEGCMHPMRAGSNSCTCPDCGVVCDGKFDGCADVWARGPRPVPVSEPVPVAQAFAAGRSRNGAPARRGATTPAGPADSAPVPAPAGDTSAVTEPESLSEPRTEVLRWFEEAFEGLRGELRALAHDVTEQQAMMAELLEARQADLRLLMVAESLPELVDDLVRKAMADHSVTMVDFVDSSLGDFRDSLRKSDAAARRSAAEAHKEHVESLESVKAALARELRPMAAALRHAVHVQERAQQDDAARLPALKASVTKQLRPVVTAMEAAIEKSDARLRQISERLDKLAGQPARPVVPAGPAKSPSRGTRRR